MTFAALLIATGRKILREEGLSAGAELLTFKQVRDRIEAERGVRIGNGSIIGRVWDSLFDYQTEVLAHIAADDSTSEVDVTLDELTPILLDADPSSEESRWFTVREVCRVGAATHMAALSRSTDYSLWIGVWAVTSVGSAPARRRRIERGARAVLRGSDRADGEDLPSRHGYRRVPSSRRSQYSSIHDRGGRPDRGVRSPEPSGRQADEWDHAFDWTWRPTTGVDVIRTGARSPRREVLRTRSCLGATGRGCECSTERSRPLNHRSWARLPSVVRRNGDICDHRLVGPIDRFAGQ